MRCVTGPLYQVLPPSVPAPPATGAVIPAKSGAFQPWREVDINIFNATNQTSDAL